MKRLTPTFMSGAFRSDAAQHVARQLFEQVVDRLAVEADGRAVDQHRVDAGRRIGHEAFTVGRHVAHPPQRSGGELLEVDHHDVGGAALADVAAIDADDIGDLAA